MTTVGIPGHGELAYCFDPQGDVVNRFNAGDAPLSAYNNVQPATDTVVWDAWGESLNDQWGGGLADVYDSQYTPVGDPSGFEAQFGYQGEWDNNLPRSWTGSSSDQYYRYEPYLLGRRYFDPSTGKFANRDPIDYAGGENLYGYAGDNPVNEVDPGGDWGFLKWLYTGNGNATNEAYGGALDQAGNTLRPTVHAAKDLFKDLFSEYLDVISSLSGPGEAPCGDQPCIQRADVGVGATPPLAFVGTGNNNVFERFGSRAEAESSQAANGLVLRPGHEAQPKWIARPGLVRAKSLGQRGSYDYKMTFRMKPGVEKVLERSIVKENEPGRFGIPANDVEVFNDLVKSVEIAPK